MQALSIQIRIVEAEKLQQPIGALNRDSNEV
jgi:hypothetical protein